MRRLLLSVALTLMVALPASAAERSVFAPDPPPGSPPAAVDSASTAIHAFLHAQCALWEATGKTSEADANKLVKEAVQELTLSGSEFDNVASQLDPKLPIKQASSDQFKKSYDVIVRLGAEKPDTYASLFRTLSYMIRLEVKALDGVVFEESSESHTIAGLRIGQLMASTGAVYIAASVLAQGGG